MKKSPAKRGAFLLSFPQGMSGWVPQDGVWSDSSATPPVTHQHTVEQMIRAGRDIERRVLAQAVQAYLDHKIIVHDRRTIIFH